jgi:hypothetical protein
VWHSGLSENRMIATVEEIEQAVEKLEVKDQLRLVQE